MRVPHQILTALVLCAPPLAGQTVTRHALTTDDVFRIHDVRNPEVSPDGKWVAYIVSDTDKEADKHIGNLWMVSWDGKERVQLTYSTESESSPKWSPDGRYLGFLSSRPGKAKGSQVWVMDRKGGEARQLTAIPETQKVEDYEFSPDGAHLLLVMRESDQPAPEPEKKPGTPAAAPAPPKPIVIDRYHFKSDEAGYIGGFHYSRLYLYDMASAKYERITNFTKSDETEPAFSADGTKIAFVSNQDDDPDRSEHSDVWVVDTKPNSSPKRLTSYKGSNGGRPAWSPDGQFIAYVQGTEPKYSAYNTPHLAVVSSDGSQPARLLSTKLDRGVARPVFSPDGKSIVALVSDDRNEYPVKFAVSDGSHERLLGGQLAVAAQSSAAGHTALLATTDTDTPEIYALEGGAIRKLTTHNDALMAELQLGEVQELSFHSAAETEVHGLLTLPPGFDKTKKYPALLRIHGGPAGQDSHGFSGYSLEHQYLAAHGYVVIAINYRGGSGRGQKYAESIFADWGHHEVEDLLAGVDAVEKMGFVDADRLGIGGWSYGGILTDYTVATDGRFKAAISGAGSANQISMYGSDQYVFQYDNEIGPPWKNPQAWVNISYPFFHADRIHTPTLFMGGADDFNVPIIGGEQMYQALKTIGVPTELVVYPGQHHGISRPSFQRDRLERYVAWYDRYLKPGTTTTSSR